MEVKMASERKPVDVEIQSNHTKWIQSIALCEVQQLNDKYTYLNGLKKKLKLSI